MDKFLDQNTTTSNSLDTHSPFIKLFRTPRGYYFFDVNRNMICPVSRIVYEDLSKRMETANWEDESEEINALKENGWLSTHRPTALNNELTDKVDLWVEHEVYQLSLQVTQACNLCCIYCPYANNSNPKLSRAHSSKTMTFEIAKRAIDFLSEKSDNVDDIFISFYGGEPLLAYPLIKQCVDYADKLFDGKRLHYLITTNATLMTDEMIDYFAEKHFLLTFSVDGPKVIHDRHRLRANGSPTYDLVMETLRKTVERYGDENIGQISINMVLNPEDPLDEIISWINAKIFDKVNILVSSLEDDYLEKKFETNSKYIEQSSYHKAITLLDYLGLVNGLNKTKLFNSVARHICEDYSKLRTDAISLPKVSCPGGPCLSGVRKLFVNVDGMFFPCEKVNELSPAMKIGDVDSGFSLEQIKRHLNIAQLTPNACLGCWAQMYCGVCQRRADGGNELSGDEKNKFCRETESDLMRTLYMSALLGECKTVYKPQKGVRGLD